MKMANGFLFLPKILVALLFLWGHSALAYTYSCTPKSNVPTSTTGNFGTLNLTSPTDNVAGYEKDDAAAWNTGAFASNITCDCPYGYNAARFFSAKPLGAAGSVIGGKYFYKATDYLEIATSVFIAATIQQYIPAPFTNYSNRASDGSGCAGGTLDQLGTGNKGKIDIRFIKPFIGESYFNNIPILDIYVNKSGTAPLTTPYLRVNLTGSIVVPQYCEVQPGTTLELDLGQITQSSFVQGGVGNKPSGYINRPLTVQVTCAGGVQADALLNVRLEGVAATNYTQALASDNPDIGIVITKPDGSTILKPNDLNSSIPIQLQNSQGNVLIQAYPISLTGQTPAVGTFTSLANLRFDFS
ncbi:fimbrial protein [Klebsiella aerogenes]|uniref:fimbrial protein n=1 Tax=Klebsiella aerogenes TaxID=548 RepID=UPI001BD1D120|nr:fimbrial protein [Klebsiella aerogenes]